MEEKKQRVILEAFDNYINEKGIIEISPANLIDVLESVVIKSTQEQVIEFMNTFNQEISYLPHIPKEEVVKLRLDLIDEEVKELKYAIEDNNLVEVGDAFADLLYVVYGAANTFGFTGILKDIQDEVHSSNMSKLCKTEDEAEATVNYYTKKEIKTYWVKENDYYLVLRSSDNKVLKSINYRPADVASIVNSIKNIGKSI